MTPSEFINKIDTDEKYKNDLIKKISAKRSRYDKDTLDLHLKDVNELHCNILLNKVYSEIYPTKKEIKIEGMT